MQQGLVSIGWTWAFQIVNILIIYLVMKRFLFKPVTSFMENRRKGIENSLEEAAQKNKDAEGLKLEYEMKLANIKEERTEMIKDATRRAEDRSDEIIKSAEVEAGKIIERAKLDIERERQKAMNELKDQMSVLAIMAASKVVEKDFKEEDHQKMIQQFIDEVGETQWRN